MPRTLHIDQHVERAGAESISGLADGVLVLKVDFQKHLADGFDLGATPRQPNALGPYGSPAMRPARVE